MGVKPICTSIVEAADAFTSCLHQMQEEAKSGLQHATDTMKLYYNHKRCHAPQYKAGDQVWLNLHNYMTDHPTKKMDHKWTGPFNILKVISPAAVKLKFTP